MDDLLNSIKNQIEDREQLEQDLAEIRSIARQDGEAAAAWYWDRTQPSQHDLLLVLRGMDNGDPAIMDTFTQPNWSGEWADDMNWEQFCEAHFDRYTDAHAEMMDDYNDRYKSAYEDALRKDIFNKLGAEVIIQLQYIEDGHVEATQLYPASDRIAVIFVHDEGIDSTLHGYRQDAPNHSQM